MFNHRRPPGERTRPAAHALLLIAATSAVAVLLGWLFGARSPLALCIGLVIGCGVAARSVRSQDVGIVLLAGPAMGFCLPAVPLLALAPSALSSAHTDIDRIFEAYDYGVPAMITGAFVALLVAMWRRDSRC